MDNETTICCGKVSAKVGAIVTGVLSIIFTLLFAFGFGSEAAGYLDEDEIGRGPIPKSFTIGCGVSCGLSLLAFIFSCLIIFGTYTKRSKLLLPWMTIVAISIPYFIIITILETALDYSLINIPGTITVVDEIISLIVFIAITVGALYVVKIEYNTLSKEY